MAKTLQDYLSLLSPEYQNSPKIIAQLTLLIQPLLDMRACCDGLYLDFDLDQAIGIQLDILGQVVGIARTLTFQPSYGLSPILTDADYRTLLKATIGKNQWDGVQGSLSILWQTLFPGAIIAVHDNQSMNMDVFIEFPNASSVFIDCITHDLIVPRPEGVLCTYYLIPPNPLFGFDYDDPYVSGCDKGYWWGANQVYPKFGFDDNTDLVSGFDDGNWAQS